MDASAQNSETPAGKTRPKLTQTLPTDRIPLPKQLEIIRAYVAAAEKGGGAATNGEVGKFVDLAESTVATANAFFVDMGFLQKVEGGRYQPTQALTEHFKVYQLSPDRSWAKLMPLFERSWMGLELVPKLKFRPLDEEEAITDLALAANAEPKHRSHLKVGIDWMVQVGLISREGGKLRLATNSTSSAPEPVTPPPAAPPQISAVPAMPPLGSINFNISLNVDMAQMATWKPENIQEFFSGVAKVLAAKAAAEKTNQ